eukprot:5079796-Amphidinium_carterae.1
MEKEIKSMLEVNKAMTLLSASESQRVRQEHSDRIIASRMHLRYKPVEGEDGKGLQYVAKARWIVLGFGDPDVLSVETRSPAPAMSIINLMILVALGMEYEFTIGDLKEAFLQGLETNRLIYVEVPASGLPGYPDVVPGQLLRMNKEVYGSVCAPSAWRKTLTGYIKELGYRQAVCDE